MVQAIVFGQVFEAAHVDFHGVLSGEFDTALWAVTLAVFDLLFYAVVAEKVTARKDDLLRL